MEKAEHPKGRNAHLPRIVLVVALALLLGAGATLFVTNRAWRRSTIPHMQSLLQKGLTPRGRLELEVVSKDPSECILLLRLRNVGPVTMNVDGDLVFLVDVLAVDSTGRAISWGSLGEAPRPDKEAMRRRFVSLPPGESVERRIDVVRGFREFRALKLWVPGPNGHGREVWQAHELIRRLPQGVWPARVTVAYGQPHYITLGGITFYTGFPYGSLSLYDAPLWAEVAIPAP